VAHTETDASGRFAPSERSTSEPGELSQAERHRIDGKVEDEARRSNVTGTDSASKSVLGQEAAESGYDSGSDGSSGDRGKGQAAKVEEGDPSSRPRHFPCFDGLRAFAALSIVVLHTAWWSGYTTRSGFGNYLGRLEIGVSVFFLISGFLLYRPFAISHLSERPAPGAGKFWVRRLLRIVPAYWLALTVLIYVIHAVSIGPGWQSVVAHYGFVQIYFPSQIFTGIVQAWSLCTEMSFYLFLPVYATVIAFRSRSQVAQLVRELCGLVLLVVISVIFQDWVLTQPVHCQPNCLTRPALVSTMTTWLPYYLDLFALGMFLAVMSAWFTERTSEPSWLSNRVVPWASWVLAAVVFYWVSHLGIPGNPLYFVSPSTNLVEHALYGVFAFFLLLPAVFGPQEKGLIRRLLRFWPVAALGVISYGIYLWHLPWIDDFWGMTGYRPYRTPFWILLVGVLALSIGAASLSYFCVELPLLRLKDRISWWGSSGRRTETPGRGQGGSVSSGDAGVESAGRGNQAQTDVEPVATH